MAKKKETYAEAISRLNSIVQQIDRNEIGIDDLPQALKEANDIIAFCSDKLTKANEEIEKICGDKAHSAE